MPVCRFYGRGGSLRGGGPGPEQVPLATLAAVGISAGIAAAVGRAVTQRAGGVGAGGLALVDQVVAVLAGGGGFAAGLRESAAGLAAAAGGAARAGQQQAQPEQAGFFSPICHSLEGPQAHRLARGALPDPGQARIAVHEDNCTGYRFATDKPA